MAFCVAHVQKFKSWSVLALEKHLNRTAEHPKNYDINPELTKYNVNLMDRTEKYNEYDFKGKYEDVLARNLDSSCKIRKDAVAFFSVVVSASPDFFKNKTLDQKENYFEAAKDFLMDFYGPESCVGAYVHYDEIGNNDRSASPHMHFIVAPILDKRLCCKKIITRDSLRKLQDELPKYLQSRGFDVERGLVDSPRYHVDTNDWKKDNLILEATKEKLMRELGEIEPTKALGKNVLSDKNYARLKSIADQSVHAIQNRTEIARIKSERQAVEIMKANLKEDEKEYLKKMEEGNKKAEEITAKLIENERALDVRERKLAIREREFENYKREQDKNIALQTALKQIEETKIILEKREKYLAEREEKIKNDEIAAVQRVRDAAKKAVLEEVERQGKGSFWKAAAMNDLKETNPEVYKKLIANAKKKSLNRTREIAGKNLENEKENSRNV